MQKIFQSCSRCVRVVLIGTILLSVVSCSTKRLITIHPAQFDPGASDHSNTDSPDQHSNSELTTVAKLSVFYKDWQHTPYRYSGNSKQGIDCSAFSQQTYKQVFSQSLPRTVAAQMNVGQEVDLAQLRPGDLVFFKTGTMTRHVGIYLRDGAFMHASTSSGVRQSQLSNVYWNPRFITGRTLHNQQ